MPAAEQAHEDLVYDLLVPDDGRANLLDNPCIVRLEYLNLPNHIQVVVVWCLSHTRILLTPNPSDNKKRTWLKSRESVIGNR